MVSNEAFRPTIPEISEQVVSPNGNLVHQALGKLEAIKAGVLPASTREVFAVFPQVMSSEKNSLLFGLNEYIGRRESGDLPASKYKWIFDFDGTLALGTEKVLGEFQDVAATIATEGILTRFNFHSGLVGTSQEFIFADFANQANLAVKKVGVAKAITTLELLTIRDNFFMAFIDNCEQMSGSVLRGLSLMASSGLAIPTSISSASSKERLVRGLQNLLPGVTGLFQEVMNPDDYQLQTGTAYQNKQPMNALVQERMGARGGDVIVFEDSKSAALQAAQNPGVIVLRMLNQTEVEFERKATMNGVELGYNLARYDNGSMIYEVADFESAVRVALELEEAGVH
jgi:hypothetical protein